ncbi:3'-5' exonuclease [Actinocorallia sp. API 0066]|uniref:3'-5' exonuclease n=1 Tax=Actinocorallia sp. API 0066 TaxID=2896846 RepID=UPI001E5CD2BF|nr:3'-5' exonuclease [Actinocorallia sp. API 0066]MCD0453321.1 3'-5' exonuclease [Actinocorallia sp. API 0066]
MTTSQVWTSHRFAVVDVEGNGQRPPDLVEIAVVPVEGGIVGEPRCWLVKSPRPITAMARRFHRIADDEVSTAPEVAEVAEDIRGELDGAVFTAHNAHVDLGVVTRSLPGFRPAEVVDTLKIARRLVPGLDSYKLGSLAEAFELTDGIPPGLSPHRATYDALVCARLLVHLASRTVNTEMTLSDLLGREKPDDPAPTLF